MAAIFQMSRREWIFGFLISSVHGMQHIYTRLLPALLPILVIGLDIPLWQLGLLVSVYLFTGGLFQAPMGVVSDLIDRRYLLVPAIVLMSVGYLVFALAPSMGAQFPALHISGTTYSGAYQIMVLAMCIAGVGYSAVHPTGYPIISANVSEANKGKVLGLWASGAKIGDTVTPILVAVLILLLRWESILLVFSVFGFAYAIGLYVVLRRDAFETRPPKRLDEGDDERETRTADSDPQHFRFPMGIMLLFFFCILFTTNGILTYTPVFVSDVYAFSFTVAGVHFESDSVANFYFSALLLSGAVSQFVVGSIADALDYRTILVALLATATLGLYVLSTVTLTPITLLLLFVALGGLIFGTYPARDAIISHITPPAYEGRAFGYLLTVGMAVGAVYPVLIGYMESIIGIRASFAYLTLGTLLGGVCICLLFSPRIYRERVDG